MGQRDNPDFLGMYIKREFDVALGCPFPPPDRNIMKTPMPVENYRIINTALAEDNAGSLAMIANPADDVVTPVLHGLVTGAIPGTKKGITSAIAAGIEHARVDKRHVFNDAQLGSIARDAVSYVGELFADKMTDHRGPGRHPLDALADRFVTNSVQFLGYDPKTCNRISRFRDLGDAIPDSGVVTIAHQGQEESYQVAKGPRGYAMLTGAKLPDEVGWRDTYAVLPCDSVDKAGHPAIYRNEHDRLSVVRQTFSHAAGYAAFTMAPRAFGDPAAADRERQKWEQGLAAVGMA